MISFSQISIQNKFSKRIQIVCKIAPKFTQSSGEDNQKSPAQVDYNNLYIFNQFRPNFDLKKHANTQLAPSKTILMLMY